MAHGRKYGFVGFMGSESGVRSKNQDYMITIGSERYLIFLYTGLYARFKIPA